MNFAKSRQSGVTLVEMMIATSILLVAFAMLSTLMRNASLQIAVGSLQIEMENDLRLVQIRLASLLRGNVRTILDIHRHDSLTARNGQKIELKDALEFIPVARDVSDEENSRVIVGFGRRAQQTTWSLIQLQSDDRGETWDLPVDLLNLPESPGRIEVDLERSSFGFYGVTTWESGFMADEKQLGNFENSNERIDTDIELSRIREVELVIHVFRILRDGKRVSADLTVRVTPRNVALL